MEDAVWKMGIWQHVFPPLPLLHSCIQGLAPKAQGAWEPALCPSLHAHLIIPVFTLLGISGPLLFTIQEHCCVAKMETVHQGADSVGTVLLQKYEDPGSDP